MPFLERFLGFSRSQAHQKGLVLLQEGHFAEAAEVLRRVMAEGAKAPAESLAGTHLRTALVAEGRRLVRGDNFPAALPYFAEAAELWGGFPDLHWLRGATAGMLGQWDAALRDARNALRLNPDYVEARLLEGAALASLGRRLEAAQALDALRESGRRVDHWLVGQWPQPARFTAEDLPADLVPVLTRLLTEESEKEKLGSAVALCRAGRWQDGLAVFADLVQKRPRFPDYRTRQAAALFQLGRNQEALAAVEAALALHDRYRSAIDLKALILADEGRLQEAWDFLQQQPVPETGSQDSPAHEALFGAYLRGVLALLVGRPEQVATLLAPWSNLPRAFARAELLLAAADTLRGQLESCGLRLAHLCREWPADTEFFFLLACHQLERDRLEDAAETLRRWPLAEGGQPDHRPLFLKAVLSLRRGRAPALPAESGEGQSADPAEGRRLVPAEAWAFLTAQAAYLRGDNADCWNRLEALRRSGFTSEQSLRIQVQAACGDPSVVPAGWAPAQVIPDSCLPGVFHLTVRTGQAGAALARVQAHARLHPDHLPARWLSSDFWLEQVRGWIG